ncbi:ComEC/Rec2 family competence protein [Aeromonas veronii]|uniref:ComEC/Rec2 family competence protein n=1 Tax=Aeromonas veronii TaxID=654 RepID=UPI002B469B4D|nr:MBL fold metallo-hydrolase [Aeromonas veronii]
MFKISALPASYGDCLWIEYGTENDPCVILIDAGPSAPKILKSRLEQLAAQGRSLELVVVTHVDRDHIGGILNLLENDFYGAEVRDLWFNGFRHLPSPDALEAFGEKQGEQLTKLILAKKIAWNAVLDNAGFMVTPELCPELKLPGGAKITLLSPDAEQLKALRANWVKVCGEADLYADIPAQAMYFGKDDVEAFGAETLDIPTLAGLPFSEDSSEANGSSIAFIIEYDGKRVLLGADAYPSRMLKSLEKIEGNPSYAFDLVKVPHHGSENNVSKEFVEALDCRRYLFSTNGSYYKHPAQPAVSRIVQFGIQPELLFNYRTAYSEIWDNDMLKHIYKYSTVYGDENGITVEL